eukprot:Platyproteum_vivax@DN296_c0_g1_i1.p1
MSDEDIINCPDFWSVGACRNGDRCTKRHSLPNNSDCLIIRGLYKYCSTLSIPEDDFLTSFYADIFEQFANFGEVEDVIICDNTSEFMRGNVYVKYANIDHATFALKQLTGRCVAGTIVKPEFTFVDFRKAICSRSNLNMCFSPNCRLIHPKKLSQILKDQCFDKMYSMNYFHNGKIKVAQQVAAEVKN